MPFLNHRESIGRSIGNKEKFKLHVGKFSFSNRVVNEWNGLSEEIIQNKSLVDFKKKIDYHLGYIRGFI